jgi:glycosyltransferase XagB
MNLRNTKTSITRLGEQLLLNKVITQQQLETALRIQKIDGGRLGPILLSLGYVNSVDLERYSPLPIPSSLGGRLIENQVISHEQLDIALDYQEQFGGRLGEILILMGFASKQSIENVMKDMQTTLPIGEMLVKSGAITQEELEMALRYQRNSGGILGDILLSLKFVSTDVLYRNIATQKRMGRAGKETNFKDARKLSFSLARKYNCAIIHDQSNRYLLAVTRPLNDEQLKDIENQIGKPIEMVLVSWGEIDSYWNSIYSEDLVEESIFKLAREDPENCAIRTFTWPQIMFFVFFCLLVSAGLITSGFTTLIIVNYIVQGLYLVLMVFKMYILWKGTSKDTQVRITQEELDALDERKLPVYTILIPMYRENHIANKLLNSVEKLDYPKSKLDIRLLLEENDQEMIETIRKLDLPPYYSTLIIPDRHPKTKPKACNYGLIHATGEYVVIYDAEDRPEPDQLKKVFLGFEKLPARTICIQSKLNYYNSGQNLLTKWFTQEYSMWFEVLLPGVVKLGIPVPLGGTSNHFKAEYLRKLGTWDPFNVTEDADLGIRLFKEGYLTAVIDSRTWEEANSRPNNWIRQRSRWVKGYMQTWLVNMRHPLKLFKELKFRGFLGFQATILGVFLPLLINPVLWSLVVLWFAAKPDWMQLLFSGPVYYSSLFLLVIGNFFFVYSGVVGIYWFISDISAREKSHLISFELVKYSLLMPVYWLLMSAASYMALWQLIVKPSHWEKTEHGLTGEYRDAAGAIE